MSTKVKLSAIQDVDEKSGGVIIVELDSLSLDKTTTPEVREVYQRITAIQNQGKYPIIIIIDSSIDVPNTSVVESIDFGSQTVTLIQVRPNVTTRSLLLTGYTFHVNGYFERKQSTNSIAPAGGYVDLGTGLSPTTTGIDISTNHGALLGLADRYYTSQPWSFAIKFNYTILTCIGVKSIDSGANFEAYFIGSSSNYRLVISRTGTAVATLYKG